MLVPVILLMIKLRLRIESAEEFRVHIAGLIRLVIQFVHLVFVLVEYRFLYLGLRFVLDRLRSLQALAILEGVAGGVSYLKVLFPVLLNVGDDPRRVLLFSYPSPRVAVCLTLVLLHVHVLVAQNVNLVLQLGVDFFLGVKHP